MEHVSTKRPPEFVSHDAVWLERLFVPVWRTYTGLATPFSRWMRRGPWQQLHDGHFLFFVYLCAGMVPLVPTVFVSAWHLLQQMFGPESVGAPKDISYPYVPAYYAIAVLLFLVTFGAGTRLRRVVLGGFSVYLLWVFGVGVPALLTFAAVATSWLLLIKSRLPRLPVFLICVASAVAVHVLCRFSASPLLDGLARLGAPGAIVIAMLWYSTYAQLPPRHVLSPPRFYLYMYFRIFGAPAASYDDYFRDAKSELLRIRFQGIKAMYSALLAINIVWLLETQVLRPLSELSGAQLLLHSYLQYVVVYLEFLIGVNTFIGIMRLFGFPIRDNFRQAFLARTPNEHWQRWNILVREWILTFVFYPLMRKRRSLFLAVMAALMASGLLHLHATITHRDGSWEWGSIMLAYWAVNGLAIYLVLKVPRRFPQLVASLRMEDSRVWAAFGILMTSIFYGLLIGARTTCRTWPEVGDFFRRLFLA